MQLLLGIFCGLISENTVQYTSIYDQVEFTELHCLILALLLLSFNAVRAYLFYLSVLMLIEVITVNIVDKGKERLAIKPFSSESSTKLLISSSVLKMFQIIIDVNTF